MIKKETKYIIRRILIGVGIALILSFIRTCQVKAESISDYRLWHTLQYRIDSGSWQDLIQRYNTFTTTEAGRSVNFRFSTQLQSDVGLASQQVSTPNLWGRLTICSEKDRWTAGWNNNYTSGVNFIGTSIPCKLANSPTYANAYITFATFKITKVEDITQVAYGDNGKITFYAENYSFGSYLGTATSWTIIAYEVSFNQFPQYSSESATFDRLDTIISAINTLISNSNNTSVVSAINNTTSAINNQTTSITNAQNNTTNAINNMDDTLKDSNVDSPNSSISNMNSQIGNNSVISDLLLLPVRFYQTILNSVNVSCTPYTLGSLFNTNITLPCINIEDLLGSTIYTLIDVGLCGIFIFSIRKKFISIFENITSLKDRGNELE